MKGTPLTKLLLIGSIGTAFYLGTRGGAPTSAVYGERAAMPGMGAQHVVLFGAGVATGLAAPTVQEKVMTWWEGRKTKKAAVDMPAAVQPTLAAQSTVQPDLAAAGVALLKAGKATAEAQGVDTSAMDEFLRVSGLEK